MNATIIILGASGDLAKKKLIPALYHLIKDKKISNFSVIGAARHDANVDDLLNSAQEYIKNIDPKIWNILKKRFYYFTLDFYNKEGYKEFDNFVLSIEKKHKLSGNRLFYLATLPSHFSVISKNLAKCGLTKQGKSWKRVVYEKPFGEDLKSAKKINKIINSVFSEKQVYRIDHYLEKELIQNLSVLRFTNTTIEPLWNNKYIDHVQIVLSEDFGVENRGNFYDKYGALKDVIQNHMLQLLSLLTMQSPKILNEKHIRDAKVAVLKSIKPTRDIVLGQYQGYLKEKGVKKNSKTDTFVCLKLNINNKKWKGVPFYLLSGKNLKNKFTSIYIQFKKADCNMFKGMCNFESNHMLIEIDPPNGFHMHVNTKVPGKIDITSVKMDFCHECTFGPNTPEAYENLLYDIMKGDQSVFIRSDEIIHQWKFIDKIKSKNHKIHTYKKGNLPDAANKLIQKDKREWYFNK